MEKLKNSEEKNDIVSQYREDDYESGEKINAQKRGLRNKFFIGAVLVVVVSSFFGASFGFVSGLIASKYLNKKEEIQKNNNENNILGVMDNNESAVINVVEKANPSVVSIVVTKDVPKFRSFFDNPFGFGPFSSPFENNNNDGSSMEKQEVGGGSGFIVSADGTIVTNKHVVSDSEAEYTAITSDNQEYKASVIVRHPTMDIALLKIEGNDFPAIDLGDSMNLKVGQ
ncbi:MAG: peptidase S1 and S6, chymotrypsin/Hap, partial [Parcubacteria group bacterium Athens0714_25]